MENMPHLQKQDPVIANAIHSELRRQQTQIELIASENFVSEAVLEAQGSILTNKYAEGYPGRRYYGGCANVDVVEQCAIDRVCALFNCSYANVQPHSGSQANQAVFMACLQPGDHYLAMGLNAGGHLTHGAKVNQSGKWFTPHHYGVNLETGFIDYAEVEAEARKVQPKLIIAGGSAYARIIDFERFRWIADQVGALLMVDMAHYAGLVAGGAYPSPLPYAHVVTSTTHKTLRGPRGGLILSNDMELGKKINAAIFPGMQGGPLPHVIAAKAVAFGEAQDPSFRTYAHQVVENARALAAYLQKQGLPIFSGGTDSHMMLVDLRPLDITGADAEKALEYAGVTCNKNGIPGDTRPPMETSGIRLGTPAMTTRGLGVKEFEEVGRIVFEGLQLLKSHGVVEAPFAPLYAAAQKLCNAFPLYT